MSVDPQLAVSLSEVKAFLRIEDSEDDVLLAGFVRSATALCEAFTGQMLLSRPRRETFSANGTWQRLIATPVSAFGNAFRLETGGETQVTAETQIDSSGDGWVRLVGSGERGRIEFTAGISRDWNGLPEPVRQGIIRLAAHLYSHRDAPGDAGPPAAVAALWRPWRRMRLS